jgi:hypothetical protein
MAIIEDLEEITPLVVGDRRHCEVINDEDVSTSDLGEETCVRSIGPRKRAPRIDASADANLAPSIYPGSDRGRLVGPPITMPRFR